MAYIIGPEVVSYACTCGLLKPITHLYLCRHCFQLRCTFCLCQEVDTIFCGKCNDNKHSQEAKDKKNKCDNCFMCPSCQQDLSTRVASKPPANPDEAKSVVKKTYYLSCYVCRWSSRDVGIPDQQSATGGWKPHENVNSIRLHSLMRYNKELMAFEKKKKENEKKKQRGKFVSLTNKTGVTASALRKRVGLPDTAHVRLKNLKPPEPVEPAIAKAEVDELPDSIFTDPIDLMEVTTIDQRLMQPELQPATIDKLFPVQKKLSIKKSLRCRQCEHSVSKPEYNPSSVKFKIQLFAYYHIPEVRIVTVEPLSPGKTSELILKFTNPNQHQTTITILDLNLEEQEKYVEDQQVIELCDSLEDSLSLKQPMSLPSLASSQPSSLASLPPKQPSVTVKPRKICQSVNCDVELPTSNFILPPRDDAAEYDDSGDNHNIKDDTKLVKWRKSNKAFIRLQVTPKADLSIDENVTCGFTFEHLYTHVIASTADNKQPQIRKYDHRIRVFLRLGKTVGSK
ncbi:dynactin subunit 4 isoform X2 [Anthonomus grandis grandis]|uniref:dynactin subunit 4 isoform X2 n=1 Tax=Anthonomus grandis grandis TaxID=2921223 RepID=UPI0021667D90|nr:dynactin subunit 4 isoform X2 [Anthonomus grandis grandis]